MSAESFFIRKLRHGTTLSDDDERTLVKLAGRPQRIDARQDIIVQGMQSDGLVQIVEGWACTYRDLPNGRRQIISFLLPGDLSGPFGALPDVMTHSIGALTSVIYARLSISAAQSAACSSPAISKALWWDVLTSHVLSNECAVTLGQRLAYERLAHLICELHQRLMLVNLADVTGFDLPLRQADLAHALGLSAVHVNRSLRALRQTGCITLHHGRLTILDLNELRDIAVFDACYPPTLRARV